MLSDALLKMTKEVMRRCQSTDTSARDLSERLCMLLRVTALTSPDPRSAVSEVRKELRPFIADLHILEALTGRVLEALDTDDISREYIEPELAALLDEVREAEPELAEQSSGLFSAGDTVVILAEPQGMYLESALQIAADAVAETAEKGSTLLTVRILRVGTDHKGVADAQLERLKGSRDLNVSVVQDSRVSFALRGASKVVLSASGLDSEDGALCPPGSSLLCAAANRVRVPVVVVCARHRIAPVGSNVVSVVGLDCAPPGEVWGYEGSRADRKHEPIAVVANRFDVVALQKVDIVVTEYGGYAPEYIKSLAPNLENMQNEEAST